MQNCVQTLTQDIIVANNSTLQPSEIGEIPINLKGQRESKLIKNVSHAPELNANLLSVSTLAKKNPTLVFNDSSCKIHKNDSFLTNGEILAAAISTDGLYRLAIHPINAYSVVSSLQSQEFWHRELGHLNDRSMSLLRKGMATGIEYNELTKRPCIACIKGNQYRLPFDKEGRTRANDFLKLVHAYISEPFLEYSWSGARYLFLLVDDYSYMTFCSKNSKYV